MLVAFLASLDSQRRRWGLPPPGPGAGAAGGLPPAGAAPWGLGHAAAGDVNDDRPTIGRSVAQLQTTNIDDMSYCTQLKEKALGACYGRLSRIHFYLVTIVEV